MRWTPEEVELLAIWCKEGLTYKEIGNELDRSSEAVRVKASYLGLSNNLQTKAKTHDEYINELYSIGSSMYPIEKYINLKTKILHKCLNCGKEYKSRPDVKLYGRGCKYCGRDKNTFGIPENGLGITYLIYYVDYDLYKIGITSKSVKERINKTGIVNYEVILERKFNTGREAMDLEKTWLNNIEQHKINTGLLNSGNTETFKYDVDIER